MTDPKLAVRRAIARVPGARAASSRVRQLRRRTGLGSTDPDPTPTASVADAESEPAVEPEPAPPVSPEAAALGSWYHRVELPDGTITPGDRDQSLVFSLYEPLLPDDLDGATVLDLGANAGGLSLEFAKRGARVTAVEYSSTYLDQAELVLRAHGVRDRVELLHGNVYAIGGLTQRFDIVCYVGLAYHLRHPQLALDLIGHRCAGTLLASSQTMAGPGLVMRNRAMSNAAPGHTVADRPRGFLYGWEPTEDLFLDMIAAAGFHEPRLVSTSPHPGESPGRHCGNRTYCIAGAPSSVVPIAVVDEHPLRPRPPTS